MNNVMVIVEGATEQTFIRDVLAPKLGEQNIFLTPAQICKAGHKGGNIIFDRFVNDLQRHIKNSRNKVVTTMFDYYRIDVNWPGYNESLFVNSIFCKYEYSINHVN